MTAEEAFKRHFPKARAECWAGKAAWWRIADEGTTDPFGLGYGDGPTPRAAWANACALWSINPRTGERQASAGRKGK